MVFECIFGYGAARKHKFESYLTIFRKRRTWRCIRCGHKLNDLDHDEWKDRHEYIDELLRVRMRQEIDK